MVDLELDQESGAQPMIKRPIAIMEEDNTQAIEGAQATKAAQGTSSNFCM